MECDDIFTDRFENDAFEDKDFGEGTFAYSYDGFVRLVDHQPNDAFRVDEDDRLRALFRAITKVLAVADAHTEQSYRDRFVECAQGNALDSLAKPVGIRRRAKEGDDHFRVRVWAGYGAATSNTTINDFGRVALNVLQTDPSDIDVRGTTADAPVVVIETDSDVIEDSLFSKSEIVDFLNDAIASAHNIEIQTTGSFEFDGPDYSPSSNTGFGNGDFGGKFD